MATLIKDKVLNIILSKMSEDGQNFGLNWLLLFQKA